MIVGDALYANAPFINDVRAIGMNAIVRVKNKRLNLVKDALGLFQKRDSDAQWTHEDPEPKGKQTKRKQKHIHVEAWDEEGFEMGGVPEPVRFLRFRETITQNMYQGKTVERVETIKEVWVVTTLGKHVPTKDVWEMIHERWDIERFLEQGDDPVFSYRRVQNRCGQGGCSPLCAVRINVLSTVRLSECIRE